MPKSFLQTFYDRLREARGSVGDDMSSVKLFELVNEYTAAKKRASAAKKGSQSKAHWQKIAEQRNIAIEKLIADSSTNARRLTSTNMSQ